MGASKEMQQGNTVINFLCFLIPIIIMHNNEHSWTSIKQPPIKFVSRPKKSFPIVVTSI